jgi:hypothetical protein
MKKIFINSCFECPHLKIKHYNESFVCKSTDKEIADPFKFNLYCHLESANEEEEHRWKAGFYSRYYGV